MKKLFKATLIIALFAASCSGNKEGSQKGLESIVEEINDKAATIDTLAANQGPIDVADLYAHVADYNGKQVTVKGTVVHVCRHSGKRLHLMSKDAKTKIRIEAIQIGRFDKELEGSEIVATGILQSQVLATDESEHKGEGAKEENGDECADDPKPTQQALAKLPNSAFWIDGMSYEVQ